MKEILTAIWNWFQSYAWKWFEDHKLLSIGGGLLLTFGKKVWAKLEPKLIDFIADKVQHDVAVRLTGYRSLYAKHLYYKHRTFDVKGFSTQGKYALELENVYVDLNVDPATVNKISQDPLRVPKEVENPSDRSIFAWLKADPDHPRNFAIIGPPGSGKTTLLKHLALLLSARKAPVRYTPVLLFLRDHSAAIGANSEIGLIDLIKASLKNLPPPDGWFEHRLRNGKCLIMLDGLDEVAHPTLRGKVVIWVERQVEFLGANRFIVSSRPNGYRDNPLDGFTALEVLPFKPAQVERFVRNWYFANEVFAHRKNDLGVRMEAEKGADELMSRLRLSTALQDLAINPLLLTLIATVHRYHSQLPGRRVELFAEICDVFLGKRQQAKGLELDFTSAQKIRVLRVLAHAMMCREVREIVTSEASDLISPVLKLVAPTTDASEFLRMIEDSSALLIQKEIGVYGFAHLTFQEYLTSLHIKEEKLVSELVGHVDTTWWHETARLYAAQADASPVVEKCLVQDRPSIEALLLATDCEQEALELGSHLRERLLSITGGAVEDADPDRRRVAAEYLLERRLRDMLRIHPDRYVDRSPVTHAEYQLFVDEMRVRGSFRQPDHWRQYQFPPGTGRQPIAGLRKGDAEAFCHWLTARRSNFWEYLLPRHDELVTFCDSGCVWQSRAFFSSDYPSGSPVLPWKEICSEVTRGKVGVFEVMNSIVRAACFIGYLSFFDVSDLNLARDRAHALDHVLDYAHARDRDFARDRDHALALDLDLDRDLARDRDFAFDLDRDLVRARVALFLNWLCVIEKRARGEQPATEGLWITRKRQLPSAQTASSPEASSKAAAI